jgi:hypothetical protein
VFACHGNKVIGRNHDFKVYVNTKAFLKDLKTELPSDIKMNNIY